MGRGKFNVLDNLRHLETLEIGGRNQVNGIGDVLECMDEGCGGDLEALGEG